MWLSIKVFLINIPYKRYFVEWSNVSIFSQALENIMADAIADKYFF